MYDGTLSFIRYIEINVYANQFKLIRFDNNSKTFELNNVSYPVPYSDSNGTNIVLAGEKIQFSTSFGLTILWDGYNRAQVLLCDSYAGSVCGLCGNGDGKIKL